MNEFDLVTVSYGQNSTSETDTDESILHVLALTKSCLLGIISILSLFGNGLTIAAIVKFPSLRTLNNYVILSLAVSDFLQPVSIGLIIVMDAFEPSEDSKYYDIAGATVANVPYVSSFLHLLVIAADRFVAVMHPLRYHSLITFRVVRNTLIATWILSIAICSSVFVLGTICYEILCGSQSDTENLVVTYQISLNVTIYILVAVSLIILYLKIAVVARKHRRRLQSMPQPGAGPEGTKPEKSSNLMTYILMVYIMTWTPMIFFLLLRSAGFSGIVLRIISTLVQQVAISNCCINILLYAWHSAQFYRAYKKLLCTRCAAT